ncbi:LLM class flavin-dependent oxidoreductase [Staphylococcus sp. Marseille-Q6910]|uniref:LLM class flavin-dependent oxidoreductase n=1 Tax=Staphylococcus sp. Marseille-Q6910 TaxID=2937990 RepID=UPI00203EB894|nr:LLM class flavin-dependent oxidoreductase [Staphylococcus sp. Marseille-Q6910]
MGTQMHLASLIYSTGLHQASWRLTDSPIERIGDIEYQIEIAQMAERGCLDAIFLADGQYVSGESTGHLSYFLEPLTTLTAISQHTQYIGLIGTVSTTFYDPYNVARLLGSLDHISHGRAGMNIVTSQMDVEGQNHSMAQLPPLQERYV